MEEVKKTYTSVNETGCCPVPNVKEWDKSSVTWDNKKFIKDYTFSIMHVPVNMGHVIKRMWEKIQRSDAAPESEEWYMLSYDLSPWKGEHYASVTKEVEGAENVTLSGKFLTKVFEGPYKDAGRWYSEMEEYVRREGGEAKKIYFFYTTCPKCYKHYGKNYTTAFAQI